MKIAVVGAGLAGLAVALGCEQADHDVTLFEAGSTVGGRMKTYQHDGHFIDAGFHVLHTAYSTVQRWIDVPALKAKPMDNCTVTIHPPTGRKRLLGDALRSPQYLLPTLKSIGIRDGLRFFKWRLGTSSRDLERSLDAPSLPISQALSQRRFRPSTQRVLEPLFAGITLDPTLSERFAFADFTWGAMAHGTMVVPQRGIGAVPQQLADRLRSTKILLNTEITDVSEKSVVANGATHAFDLVILAVPQHVAARLLPKTLESHRPVERLTSTVVFAASRPSVQTRTSPAQRNLGHQREPSSSRPRSDQPSPPPARPSLDRCHTGWKSGRGSRLPQCAKGTERLVWPVDRTVGARVYHHSSARASPY